MRPLRAFAAAAVLVAAVAASAAGAHSSAPSLYLDYTKPISAPGGGHGTFAPLDPSVIQASLRDLAYLRYRRATAWGGFLPAPVDGLVLSQPGGSIQSFTFVDAPAKVGTGSSGTPVVPPPPLPRRATGSQPLANGCFGGCAKPSKHHAHPKTRRGGTGNCGTAGLSITIDRPHCRIHVVNRRPGQSTIEHVTIRNTSSSRYVVSFRAAGKDNALWRDMQLGIWKRGSKRPASLPRLHTWTKRFAPLAALAPGKSVRLTIEMRLPLSAGSVDEHLECVVAFLWRAGPKR